MKVHVLQHVPFEGLGSIEPWLLSRGAVVSFTRFYESAELPSPHGLDLIIAMGGPMSVNDEAALPWLIAEKQFIREAIGHGTSVLGICLGSQLIASALGARVYPNKHREIGWFDILSTSTAPDSFRFPERASVFHWHGETFDLPAGATRLARSAACENQAFQVGRNVIGLQFHIEVTEQSVDALVTHGRSELVTDTFVQSEEALRSVPASRYEEMHPWMAGVLEYLADSRNGEK
ncbi:amidotransferase [Verrucomicrobiaceae bacterium SCGC AG-212-N21]|nr:amidotransferase [Verrucomicrobiaceae bacterium SCGC AG-212-N21]